jgi:hypothetical protein
MAMIYDGFFVLLCGNLLEFLNFYYEFGVCGVILGIRSESIDVGRTRIV